MSKESAQQVFAIATKRSVVESFLSDSYELRRDRGCVWLQHLAIFILRKLRCYAIQKTEVFERHVIDGQKLIGTLHLQHYELMQTYDLRGERLLIGPEEYRDLLNNVEPRQMISFDVSYPAERYGEMKIADMHVTVIPWMRGMLVVPKLGDKP